MSQKLHQLTFKWPAMNATHVVVTGTFDNWSKSVTMQRLPEGGFVAQVDVPWDTTIFYKFVQDGNWLIDSQQPHCDDGGGRVNNYCTTPKAPVVAANTAETTLSADKGEARPAAPSEPSEPAVIVKDHVSEAADKASTVPDAPAEAEVVPLAAAVEHPTDIVPEAATGPATHADAPAPTLPLVEVLPSSDALPTTAPVESAASEPPAPDVAAAAETTPPPVVEETPAPVTEAVPAPAAEEAIPAVDDIVYATANTDATADAVVAAAKEATPAAITEAVPAPVAEIVPAVDDIVYATANTDATADAIVAAAQEAAPATPPAATTDVVAPAVTEATPAKVDAAVAEDKPTASGKPTSETPAKAVGEPKDAKAVGEPKDAKAPTTPPAAASKTEETTPAKPRLEGKGSVKADRHSRTYSSLKGKLFPSHEHEKANGVSEHGDVQMQRSASTKSSPPRQKRRSFFGRVASIFKPSS